MGKNSFDKIIDPWDLIEKRTAINEMTRTMEASQGILEEMTGTINEYRDVRTNYMASLRKFVKLSDEVFGGDDEA